MKIRYQRSIKTYQTSPSPGHGTVENVAFFHLSLGDGEGNNWSGPAGGGSCQRDFAVWPAYFLLCCFLRAVGFSSSCIPLSLPASLSLSSLHIMGFFVFLCLLAITFGEATRQRACIVCRVWYLFFLGQFFPTAVAMLMTFCSSWLGPREAICFVTDRTDEQD